MRRVNPINISTIDHVVLRVEDFEPMIDFYCEVLGCRLERLVEQFSLAQLRAGAALIDLVDARGPLGQQGGRPPDHGAPNLDHLCLRIEPWNTDAIVAHLAEHQVAVGDVGTRYGATGSGPSIYIKDPEGNTTYIAAAFPSQCGKTNLAIKINTLTSQSLRISASMMWLICLCNQESKQRPYFGGIELLKRVTVQTSCKYAK